jgi:hypothetical protein
LTLSEPEANRRGKLKANLIACMTERGWILHKSKVSLA